MLGGGKGYYRGSTILVSGTAGSGKSSMAAHFIDAACRRGERALYFAFEESPSQIARNMRSIGLELEPWVKKGLLQFHAARSSFYGLEMHLTSFHKKIVQFEPQVVVVDPISSMTQAGNHNEAAAMLTRLIDFLKSQHITGLLTNLTSGDEALEKTAVDVSSLVDTWLLLRDTELGGERNRAMFILKSRGMAHSNQIREFLLTDRGVELADVYLGPEGVLTGSARQAQEAREKAATLIRQQEIESKQRERQRKREALEARIDALRKEFEAEEEESQRILGEEQTRDEVIRQDRERMKTSRKADNGDEAAAPGTRSVRNSGGRR